jgi:hypothetical protein
VLNQKKVPILTTGSKIQEFFESQVLSQLENWTRQLSSGDLLGFENSLGDQLQQLHNHVCDELLPQAAGQVSDRLCGRAKAQGCRKIVHRPLRVKVSTGHFVEVASPYVKQPCEGYDGERHLLSDHWSLIGGASPGLYDQVGFCTAIAPSFESGHQLLEKFGVSMCLSSVQKLSHQLADKCHRAGESQLSLKEEESVADKTVVIGIDGGRTRTREYTTYRNKEGNLCYETPWREPKLFVIDVLDEKGRVDHQELPLYGTRFDQEDLFELLEQYLQGLSIGQAKRVQIVADGAPWIWNHLKPMLLALGLEEDRITETLDVWHGSEYVHKLVDNMGSRKTEAEKRKLKKQYTDWLWSGKSDKIVAQCKEIFKRKNNTVRRCIAYLDKHLHRTQYADFKKLGLMCGSGIVESAIRRVINLRFKNAATFWYDKNVEKMYFLRGAVLSGRWNTVVFNLQK